MDGDIKTRRVFISYSWSSPDHEARVVELAQRLVSDGIDVILDKWDLKEGNDKYAFMEESIRSEQTDKVLLLCDRKYSEKADRREGGAGTEAQIITPQLYESVNQTKFIPVICEQTEEGKPCCPRFIESRIYIDLSESNSFEEGYERLVRSIYDKPLYTKPKLGNPPAFIREESINNIATRSHLRKIRDAIERNPRRINGLIEEFADIFINEMKQFSLTKSHPENLDLEIVDSISKMVPFRDDYIEFINLLCEGYENINPELLLSFFEKLYVFTEPIEEDISTYSSYCCDHYKFLLHELFLYSIIILLKKRRYSTVGGLIYGDFYLQKRHGEPKYNDYGVFRNYLHSIEENYKRRIGSNTLSVHAEILIQRIHPLITKQELINTDTLLCYITCLHISKFGHNWFPITYVYWAERKIDLLARCESRKYFDSFKSVLGFDDDKSFIEAIKKMPSLDDVRYPGSFDSVPSIRASINPEKICTLP